jgi:hypothetical protein
MATESDTFRGRRSLWQAVPEGSLSPTDWDRSQISRPLGGRALAGTMGCGASAPQADAPQLRPAGAHNNIPARGERLTAKSLDRLRKDFIASAAPERLWDCYELGPIIGTCAGLVQRAGSACGFALLLRSTQVPQALAHATRSRAFPASSPWTCRRQLSCALSHCWGLARARTSLCLQSTTTAPNTQQQHFSYSLRRGALAHANHHTVVPLSLTQKRSLRVCHRHGDIRCRAVCRSPKQWCCCCSQDHALA